jgi:hypothetical protein
MNPYTGIRPREQMDGEKEATAVIHCGFRIIILKLYDPHDLNLLSFFEAYRISINHSFRFENFLAKSSVPHYFITPQYVVWHDSIEYSYTPA